MHWADVIAERLAARGDKHVIATGITPSGHIHVGNMREVLTADIITRACEDRSLDVEMIYIADDQDPLRKVYPFLDESVYSEHVGRALADIPSPDGEGSYADHFLKPFFATLDALGIKRRTIRASEAYRDGQYIDAIRTFCDKRDEVRAILDEVRKTPLPETWFPYNPADANGSQIDVTVTGYDWPMITWTDGAGNTGESDLRSGEGKLPWRLDWAARWVWAGVTCEPFGKDHAAAGGSWDTGQKLVRLLDGAPEPPMGVPYEWINLRGKGAMSSSTGNTVSGAELLEIVPPEIMRHIVSKVAPKKSIDFDPGAGLITIADEYERLERQYHETLKALGRHTMDSDMDRKTAQKADTGRGFELAQVRRDGTTRGDAGLAVSFAHLSLLCQIKPEDAGVLDLLAASHGIDPTDERILERIARMRNWIASDFFPQESRIQLLESHTAEWKASLSEEDRQLLSAIRAFLVDIEWAPDAIQQNLPDVAKALELPVRNAFRLTYESLLGRSRGPKAGTLLSAFEREDVLATLDSALA